MPMQTTQKKANPQGKGLVPVVNLWQSYQPATIEKKTTGQLFAEYFTSLLILSADFRFKPVQGAIYFLYLNNQRWMLSLIEPEHWGHASRGEYFGSCQLQEDMTWSINRGEEESSHPDIDAALNDFYHQMVSHLDSEKPLIEILPFYPIVLNCTEYNLCLFISMNSPTIAVWLLPVLPDQCDIHSANMLF